VTAVLLTRPPGSLPETLTEYAARGGWEGLRHALATLAPVDVVRLVSGSMLLGRGGAAFPAGRKWELARAAEAHPKHVVANGGEHEPGSQKDRLLVSSYPHTVLEGLALCAYATGASSGVLYLIEDMTEAAASAREAIAEARGAGLLGEGILGTRFDLAVEVVMAPATYVAGEETAALEVIEGRKAWPRQKPPYPGQSGLHGKPTTVNNVETLAHVPGIVLRGADWFRGLASHGGAGTMLFTLDETVLRPGVHEMPLGATFRDLIYGRGGGPRSGRAIRAIQPALSSAFLPASALDLSMTHEAVRAAGSGLGCGGIRIVEEGECLLARVVAVSEFFMHEQCGQCPPCRMETNTLAAVMKQVQGGQAGDYAAQVERITAFTRGKGYCNLIEMAAAPVASALRLFPEEFEAHAHGGRCSPAVT
jgi:NADH:ubiquinone oxidoreductase subunit F (NADH-binding)